MYIKEFMDKTGLSVKTSQWLHDNVFYPNKVTNNKYRTFSIDDVNYVLSRKLENYSEGRLAQITEFPNYYVSDTGKVYTYKRGILEEISGYYNYGYHIVVLHNYNKSVHMRVSRLVGQYFVPNPYNKPIIDHLDGDKTNNHYTNLEWVTYSENTQRAFDMKLIENKKGFEDSQSIPVIYLVEHNPIGIVFGSISEASKYFGMSKSSIIRIANENKYRMDNNLRIQYKNSVSFTYYQI